MGVVFDRTGGGRGHHVDRGNHAAGGGSLGPRLHAAATQQPGAASTQPNAGAPDLFPPQNPTPGEAQAPGQAAPQNPAPSIDPSSPEAQAANDPNTEVLTKGAIHEAFAQPVVFNPTPSAVVPNSRRIRSKKCRPNKSRRAITSSGSPAIGPRRPTSRNSSGPAASGGPCRQGVEWVPGYWNPGRRRLPVGLGLLAERHGRDAGQLPAAGAAQDARARGPSARLLRPTTRGFPGIGCGGTSTTPGVPVSGRRPIRTGFGCRPITCGLPTATFLSMDIGTTAMEHRGVFFAPVVFRPGVFIGPGFVLYAGRRDGLQRLHRAASSAGPAATASATTTGRRLSASAFIPGSHGTDALGTTRASPTTVGGITAIRVGGIGSWSIIASASDTPRRGRRSAYAASLRFGGPALAVHINVFAARGGGMRFERIGAARRAAIHREVREQHAANARRGEAERRAAREGSHSTEIHKSNLSASHGATAAHPQQARPQQRANTRQPARTPPRQARRPGEK